MTHLRLMMASPVTRVLPATMVMASPAATSMAVSVIRVVLQQRAHVLMTDPTPMPAHAAPDTQRLAALVRKYSHAKPMT
jgi:hypothetical protein